MPCTIVPRSTDFSRIKQAAHFMASTNIGILSICLYLISTAYIGKHFYQKTQSRTAIIIAWLAVTTHICHNALGFNAEQGFNFSFFNTASLISSLVALLLLLAVLSKPVEKLGVVIFPLASAMLVLALVFIDKKHHLQTVNWQMNTHILVSIIAFGLLNIAALQAIFLSIQEKKLKSHLAGKFIHALPPLQTMEKLLFQMIGTGLLFLTISLISGFIFIEDLFVQHLVHKTVLSIFAWLIFFALLSGRIRYGWRGQTAMRWTMAGFASLLLAYFGSKFVLELILKTN